LEESKEEPEMVSEPIPEVVLVEGATIVTQAATPPPHGAAEASSLAPHAATAVDVAAGVVGEPEVVMGHPTSHASDDIPLNEAVSMAHRALSQAQRVLRREDEDLADERRRLQLWTTMLMETTTTERVAAWAWQHGFDLQVEAINQCDADSKRALADAQELYASVEARASAVIKQEEDLIARTRQVNQQARDVEELERQLLEWEELDDITLHRELEVLGTRESTLDHHEAHLDRVQKALGDAHA
jgi:hypothetical protein